MKKFLVTITDILEIQAEDEYDASNIVNERTGMNALIQSIEEVDNFFEY